MLTLQKKTEISGYNLGLLTAEREVSTIPAVEPKHGEWIEREVFDAIGKIMPMEQWQSARCSICGKYHTTPYTYYFDEFKFCPNCGAKMKGADDDSQIDSED